MTDKILDPVRNTFRGKRSQVNERQSSTTLEVARLVPELKTGRFIKVEKMSARATGGTLSWKFSRKWRWRGIVTRFTNFHVSSWWCAKQVGTSWTSQPNTALLLARDRFNLCARFLAAILRRPSSCATRLTSFQRQPPRTRILSHWDSTSGQRVLYLIRMSEPDSFVQNHSLEKPVAKRRSFAITRFLELRKPIPRRFCDCRNHWPGTADNWPGHFFYPAPTRSLSILLPPFFLSFRWILLPTLSLVLFLRFACKSHGCHRVWHSTNERKHARTESIVFLLYFWRLLFFFFSSLFILLSSCRWRFDEEDFLSDQFDNLAFDSVKWDFFRRKRISHTVSLSCSGLIDFCYSRIIELSIFQFYQSRRSPRRSFNEFWSRANHLKRFAEHEPSGNFGIWKRADVARVFRGRGLWIATEVDVGCSGKHLYILRVLTAGTLINVGEQDASICHVQVTIKTWTFDRCWLGR